MSNSNSKIVYLLHGWGGRPAGGFRLWLKDELEKLGYKVVIPTLPNTNEPNIEEQLSFLQDLIIEPGEDVIVVGHSLGGQLVLRYLEALPLGKKIFKAVLVAGVVNEIMELDEKEAEIAKPWLMPVNAEKVKNSVEQIIALFSDNDQFIPLASEKIMREQFNAKTIIEHGMGHYSDDEGLFEAPSVLRAIID